MTNDSEQHSDWPRAGLPANGWSCAEIVDLGAARVTCGMCRTTSIQFVHGMTHPDVKGILGCGVECAERMEDDVERVRRRDARMRARASRRKRFPDVQGWKLSAAGNAVFSSRGYRVTIYEMEGGFKAVVRCPSSDTDVSTRRPASTLLEAKLMAFDLMTMHSDDAPPTDRPPSASSI